MSNSNEERKVVETELSIHPELEDRLSNFQKECLTDEIASLPPIKEGDVNVSTDYIFDMGDSYEASIFIRNGLSKAINLEYVPFVVIDGEGKVLVSKLFDLREIGDVPASTVRPWKIYFSKEEVNFDGKDLRELKIVFDTRIKAEATLKVEYENLPEQISLKNKEKYTKFLERLPLLRKGQVSISTYDVVKTKEGGIAVTIVIRNGSNQAINLEKLPITITDSEGEMIASGMFYLKDVVVNPYKAKIYNFNFENNEINKPDFDLKEWKVSFNMSKDILVGEEEKNEK